MGRAQGKTIRPLTLWRAEGGGLKWQWKALPTPRPLYRLNDIVAHPTVDILVVEGEHTADAARELVNGMIVCTWSDGAKAVDKTDWGPLRGRRVTLWGDADEDGAQAVDDIITVLRKVGAERIRRVKLPPGIRKGWDLADWHSDIAFNPVELIEQAEEVTPELEGVCNPVTLVGKPAPERQWLVYEYVPTPYVTGIYGATTTGKTLLEQQLQTCCAIGVPWLGLRTQRLRSFAVYCEDIQDELEIRQHRINEHYGCGMGDLGDMRWISRFGEDNMLAYFDRDGRIQLTDFYRSITAYARGFGAKLVVIDTAADTFGGSEIIRGQVRQFVSVALGALARDINGAVVLSLHPSRAGATEGYSGSTAWEATLRSALHLKRPTPEDGEEVDENRRILERTAINYAARGQPIELEWKDGVFHLVPGETGVFASITKSRAETGFLEGLEALDKQGRQVSASRAALNYAPKAIKRMPQARGVKLHDLECAMENLFDRGIIAQEPYGPPSKGYQRIVRTKKDDLPGCS